MPSQAWRQVDPKARVINCPASLMHDPVAWHRFHPLGAKGRRCKFHPLELCVKSFSSFCDEFRAIYINEITVVVIPQFIKPVFVKDNAICDLNIFFIDKFSNLLSENIKKLFHPVNFQFRTVNTIVMLYSESSWLHLSHLKLRLATASHSFRWLRYFKLSNLTLTARGSTLVVRIWRL